MILDAGALMTLAEVAGGLFVLWAVLRRRSAAFELALMPVAVLMLAPLLGALTFPLVFAWLAVRSHFGAPVADVRLQRMGSYQFAIASFGVLIGFSVALSFGGPDHPERPFQIASAFLFGWLVHRRVRTPAEVREVLIGLLVSGVAVGAPEALRVLTGGDIHASDAAYGAGPLLLGRITGLGLATLVLYRHDLALRLGRSASACAVAVLVGGLIATGTRSVLVGLGIGAVVWFLSRSKVSFTRKVLWTTPLAAGCVWLASATELRLFEFTDDAGRASQNVDARGEIWRQAIRTVGESPLFGAGVGNFSGSETPVFDAPSAHSIVLEAASESGLLAAGFLLFALAASARGASIEQLVLFFVVLLPYLVSSHLGVSHHLFLVLGIVSLRLPDGYRSTTGEPNALALESGRAAEAAG